MFLFSRRWLVAPVLLFVGVALTPGTASADLVLSMNGQTDEFSQSGGTFGGNILTTFADTGLNQVTLTIDLTGVSGPPALKVGSFYFNIAGISPLDVSASLGTPSDVGSVTINRGVNAFKADGDGFFDFEIGFANNGPDAFTPGEVATFVLSGPSGLTSNSFSDISVNGPAGKTGFYAAAHVQAIDGGSGWFKGDPVPMSAVPEPSTLFSALIGTGTLALAGLRRRRLSRAA